MRLNGLVIKAALAASFSLLAAESARAGDPAGAVKLEKGPLQDGTPAPVFQLRTLDGSKVKLDDIAYPGKEKSYAKKRPIFLDFFRTNCEPCKKAMPELVALHQRYQPEGLEVILVALIEEQDGRAKLERYLAEHKLPFTVVVDETEYFAKKYLGATAILPATFLIDHNGTLRKVKYGSSGNYQDYFGNDIPAVIASKKSGEPAPPRKE